MGGGREQKTTEERAACEERVLGAQYTHTHTHTHTHTRSCVIHAYIFSLQLCPVHALTRASTHDPSSWACASVSNVFLMTSKRAQKQKGGRDGGPGEEEDGE